MNCLSQGTPYSCSGCGTCTAVCPTHAISLKINRRGFFEASIDMTSCIDCGLCVNVCTRFDLGSRIYDLHLAKIFAVQSKNKKTLYKCSSGGIAHELALWGIKNGYKICGAVYNNTTDIVQHLVKSDTVDAFDGSKYLQSDTSVFGNVIEMVSQGEKVMVFGTPCQIAGLAKAAEIKKCRDQLFLTEVFCHGVPTYHLWHQELERVKRKLNCEKFDDVEFRFKKNGWHSYCLRFRTRNKQYYGSREGDYFYRVFFEDILLNNACINCRMRKEQSLADIRLGDYWGKRYQKRDDGVSVAFCNTALAGEIMVRLPVNVMQAGDADEILACQNMDGYYFQKLHDETMMVLENEGIEKAIRYYRAKLPAKDKMKGMALLLASKMPDSMRAKLRKMR